jgi:hypothetical protein
MWFNHKLFKIATISTLLSSCGSNNMLNEIKKLDQYPSASGIEYFNKQFYLIGDDANDMLILDSNFNQIDTIQLYSFTEKRIPKKLKADLEGITITKDKKLLITGSGSLSPYRYTAWLIDPVTQQKDSMRLDTFYNRLLSNGIKEINIEGICAIPGSMILTNRGNKGYPKNHFILTSDNFWTDQANAPISIILAGSTSDSTSFTGISGLTYSKKSDRLFITASTEDTRNNMDDGTIGKSYLWIITNISGKKKWKAINPDHVIDLEKVDPRFKGHKIESVCIVKETRNFIHLVLSADNDTSCSTLFKMIVEKK